MAKKDTTRALAPSGAQIVENVNKNEVNQATVKKVEREPKSKKGQNTMEYRLDYVCTFLGVKKENVGEMTTLDFSLDDICRMDFVQHFVNLKELTLNN